MWSLIGSNQQQRGLWHAIDPETGAGLAYVAERKDAEFLDLKALLEPFVSITQFYTDSWGADERHIELVLHTVGSVNIQTIERKYLTLRTRIRHMPLAERSAIARRAVSLSSGDIKKP